MIHIKKKENKDLLQVLTIPEFDDKLREKSKDLTISEILSPEFQEFIDDMLFTVKNHTLPEGWIVGGLASIQVGKPLRMFLAYNGISNKYDLYINPEIELKGNIHDIEEEGCLSVPDKTGNVKRRKSLKITFLNRQGERKRKKRTGWNARVIQHEYDHLDGILFVDKLVG
jgi:peptide deformylase